MLSLYVIYSVYKVLSGFLDRIFVKSFEQQMYFVKLKVINDNKESLIMDSLLS